jgi:hypothetical protein
LPLLKGLLGVFCGEDGIVVLPVDNPKGEDGIVVLPVDDPKGDDGIFGMLGDELTVFASPKGVLEVFPAAGEGTVGVPGDALPRGLDGVLKGLPGFFCDPKGENEVFGGELVADGIPLGLLKGLDRSFCAAKGDAGDLV